MFQCVFTNVQKNEKWIIIFVSWWSIKSCLFVINCIKSVTFALSIYICVISTKISPSHIAVLMCLVVPLTCFSELGFLRQKTKTV